MEKVDYLFNSFGNWRNELKEAFRYKIDGTCIDIAFREFWESNDEISDKYIDILENSLDDHGFKDYDEFYDDEIEYLMIDLEQQKKLEYLEDIEKFGMDAAINYSTKWKNLDSLRVKNYYGISFAKDLTNDQLATIFASMETEELLENDCFSDELLDRYEEILRNTISSIANQFITNDVLYQEFLFDSNVISHGIYTNITLKEMEGVFTYYYKGLITSDTFYGLLDYCDFIIYPSERDYDFIKDFEEIEELLLWLKLQ